MGLEIILLAWGIISPSGRGGFSIPLFLFPAPQRAGRAEQTSCWVSVPRHTEQLGSRRQWSSLRHSFLLAARNLSHLRQSPTVRAHSQLFQWKMRLIPLICLSPRLWLRAPWGNYFFRADALENNRSYPAKQVSGLQQSRKGRSSHPKTAGGLELRNRKCVQCFLHIWVVTTQATRERGWKSTDPQTTSSSGLHLGCLLLHSGLGTPAHGR